MELYLTFKVSWIWYGVNFIFPCEIVKWIYRLSKIIFHFLRSDIWIGDVCLKKHFYWILLIDKIEIFDKFDFWSLLKYSNIWRISLQSTFFFFRIILLCQFAHLNLCNLRTCIFCLAQTQLQSLAKAQNMQKQKYCYYYIQRCIIKFHIHMGG